MNFNFIPIILALIASVFASFVGLKQKIVWSFMGGFVISELTQSILSFYIGNIFSLYGYGTFVSCIVGITFAIFVHSAEGK